jgi:DeoR/GlpR family transcriptional regulator of sugar metabolism
VIRRASHIAEKKKIAAKAVRHIHPGDTVFLDASSTTYFLSEYLHDIPDLTVITNNPYLSAVLASQQIRTLCTGGEMLHASVALVGREAERFVGGFSANACFFSARGLAQNEATDSSKAERDIKIAMLERARHHFFLCDSSKYGQQYAFRIGDAELFDEIIDES